MTTKSSINKSHTDRAIRTMATKDEYARVFEHFNLPGRDIYAECSDGMWVRHFWQNGRHFNWDRWHKLG